MKNEPDESQKYTSADFHLGIINLSLQTETPKPRWNDQFRMDIMSLGPVQLLVTNSNGQEIGYKNGDYINTIPDAVFQPIASSPDETTTPIITLPQPASYTIHLSSSAMAIGETGSIAQFGNQYAVTIEDIPISSTMQDTIAISPDGTTIAYTASEDKAITITQALDISSASYQFKIQNINLQKNETMSVQTDQSSGLIKNKKCSGGKWFI